MVWTSMSVGTVSLSFSKLSERLREKLDDF